MTVYAIAQLKFTDETSYRRYEAAFFSVWKKFRGTLLVADEAPQVLEGHWDSNKVVMMSFPDEQAFREWSGSAEYTAIARDRLAGAETTLVVVRGFSPAGPKTRGGGPSIHPR